MTEEGDVRAPGCGCVSQRVEVIFHPVHMAVGVEDDHPVKGGKPVQRLQRTEIAVSGYSIGPQRGVKGERLLEVAQAVAQKDERVDAVRLGGQNVFEGQTAVVAVAQNQKFRHGKRILLKFYSGSRCWMVSSALYTSLLE